MMRLSLRTTWPQGSPSRSPCFVSGRCEPEDALEIVDSKTSSREATTVVDVLAFQGRDRRAHFDWDAPPVCSAATVVARILPIRAIPDCGPW